MEFALFRTVFGYYGNISHIKAVGDEQMNKLCFSWIVWSRVTANYQTCRGKTTHFTQLFVPLRPDVAKRQHAGIWLSINCLNFRDRIR